MSLGLLAAAGDHAVVDDAADESEGAAEARALIAADGALASVLRRHRAAHVLGVTPTNSLKKENREQRVGSGREMESWLTTQPVGVNIL